MVLSGHVRKSKHLTELSVEDGKANAFTGRPSMLNGRLVGKIQQAKSEGLSYRKIAKSVGVSLGTVQNALKSNRD